MKANSTPSRRLISLCFLLALVILLMRKAADPVTIERGFRALGVPLADDRDQQTLGIAPTTSSADTENPQLTDSSTNTENEASQRWNTVCRDLAQRLVGPTLLPEQTMLLAQRWYSLSESTAADDNESSKLQAIRVSGQQTLEAISQELASSDSQTDSQWDDLLERFSNEWDAAFDSLLSSDGPEFDDVTSDIFRSAIQTSLDAQLVNNLRDASPWTKPESAGFWRLLMKTSPNEVAAGIQPVELIPTPLLESEGADQKGKSVRYRAEVRTIEFVTKPNESLGIDGYWLLWVQGLDRAVQPVAIYSAQPLEPIAQMMQGNIDSSQVFPEIEVRAYIGKRLAYNANDGVRVAPTLFADQVSIRERAAPVAATSDPAQIGKDFRFALGVSLAATALVLIPIVWSWNRRATRRPQSLFKNKKMLWFLVACLLGQAQFAPKLTAQSAQSVPTELPPWAKQDIASQQKRKAILQRFQNAGTDETANHFQAFVESKPNAVPDDLLKAFRILDQNGWRESLTLLSDQKIEQNDLIWTAVDLKGTAIGIQPFTLSQDQDDWFRASTGTQLFRVEMALSQAKPVPQVAEVASGEEFSEEASALSGPAPEPNSSTLTVVCEFVPQRWLKSESLQQPVRVQGLVAERNEKSILAIAKRLEWRIAELDDKALAKLIPQFTQQERELGQKGWDLTWLDIARKNHTKPLAADEAEGFYSLLNCLRPDTLTAPPSLDPDLKLEPHTAILNARASSGKQIQWFIRIVSGSVIQVDGPMQQQDLGSASYYQFDGFVDIGNNRFNYRVGDEVLTFEREFPITIVTTASSEFVDQNAISRGELSWDVGQYAQVDGRFYRMWSYQSELVEQTASGFRQNAPLIVGTHFTPAVPNLGSNSVAATGWFSYALCGATVLFAGTLVVLAVRRDKPVRRRK